MLGAATLAGLPSDVPRNRVADKGRDEVRLSVRNPPGDESAHERELRPEDPGRPPGDERAGGGTGHATLVVAAETSLSRAGLRPVRAGPCAISCGTDPETDLRPVRAGRVSAKLVGGSPGSGRSGTGPAYVMRAQRDRIHPDSRHASPARQNPPRRDSREPTSHNSSSGDMTNSTPPGAPSGRSAAGAAGTGRRPRRRRWGIPAPGGAMPVVVLRDRPGMGDPRPRALPGGARIPGDIGRGPSLRAAARGGGLDVVGAAAPREPPENRRSGAVRTGGRRPGGPRGRSPRWSAARSRGPGAWPPRSGWRT